MQAYGLELLLAHENMQHARQEREHTERRLAESLIASGQYLPYKILPDVFAQDGMTEVQAGSAEADAAYARGEVVEDFSEVTWQSPADSGEQAVMADLEAFAQAMAANHSVSLAEGGEEWL